MAARKTDAERALYAIHRFANGFPRAKAARLAGVSNAWAVKFDRDADADPSLVESLIAANPTGGKGVRGPIPPDELTPLAAALLEDFGEWRVKVMGHRSKPWAVEAAHEVAERYESEDREFVVINVAPGAGKSQLFSVDIPLWLTCRSRTIRGVVGSIKQSMGSKFVTQLRTECARSDNPRRPGQEGRLRGAIDAEFTMAQLYGRFKPIKPEVWTKEGFVVEALDDSERTAKEFTWFAASMEQDFIGDRVNFQSWDDAATIKSSRSADIRAAHFEQWGVIEDRLEPGGLLLLVGQRLTLTDIYRHALDKKITREIEAPSGDIEFVEAKKYFHVVYRAHDEERCRALGDGNEKHARTAEPWPAGCLLDPQGLPWFDLQAAMANRGEFLLKYQQDDTASPDAVFKPIFFDGGRDADTAILYPGCWDHLRSPGEIPRDVDGHGTVSYATVDPSASGWWIVQWWLFDRVSEKRFLVDMHRAKMGANDLLDFELGQAGYSGVMNEWQDRSARLGHKIRFWVMEQNSQQRWLSQYEWARQWHRTRGVSVIGHETWGHNKLDAKLGPEGSLAPLLRTGTIRLPGTPEGRALMRPLVDEFLHWGAHPTNDCVMAAWMGELHLPTMVKQPDEGFDAPRMDRPSWMRKQGEVRRSHLALLRGGRDD